jgi:hypothetical protein
MEVLEVSWRIILKVNLKNGAGGHGLDHSVSGKVHLASPVNTLINREVP